MYAKMPGKPAMKSANLRAAYGYMMTHPGKKLIFMGQDLGMHAEWTCTKALPWDEFEGEEYQQMKVFMRDLLKLYRTSPALYDNDTDPEGFEWINSLDANENLLIFLRKGASEGEDLLVVCNFSPLVYEKRKIGVPYSGKYKEIFNSDAAKYGGSNVVNPRVKPSKKEQSDEREDSITVDVPPMGISIFRCAKLEDR